MDYFKNMNLPPSFTYYPVTCEENEYVFRIKEVKDKESAMNWLSEFSARTKSAWRKSKTYPRSGRHNLFRLDMRCDHSTDRRRIGFRRSKHTGCEAKLKIIVKRFIQKSKAKIKDDLIEEFPTVINLSSKHNHPLNAALDNRFETPRKKAIKSEENEAEPYSNTTESIEYELSDSSIACFDYVGNDSSSTGKLSPLDSQMLEDIDNKAEELSTEETQMFEDGDSIAEKLSPEGTQISEDSDSNSEKLLPEETHIFEDGDGHAEVLSTGETQTFEDGDSDAEKLSPEEELKLEATFYRIAEGLDKDPQNFVPAVRKFLSNVERFAVTDWGLLSALHTFGTCSGTEEDFDRCSTSTGVRRTAIRTRKLSDS